MNDLPWRNPDYFGPTEDAEKKRLKRDVSRSCWILLLQLLLANVLAFVITFSMSFSVIVQDGGQSLAGAADLNGMAAAFGMSPALFNFIISYLPTLIAEILAIVMLRRWAGFRLNETRLVSSRTRRPVKMTVLSAFGCWGGAAVASVAVGLLLQLLQLLGWNMAIPNITVPAPAADPAGFGLIVAYVCVAGPVLEEIIFRGLILNGLKKYSEAAGILISTVLFVMFHGNLVQTVTPLLLGLLLGFVTVRTASLKPAIVCHILNNTAAVAMGFFPEAWGDAVFGVYALIGLASLGYFLYCFAKERKELRQFGRLDRGERTLEVLLAPGFIVFFIVYLLLTAIYFII